MNGRATVAAIVVVVLGALGSGCSKSTTDSAKKAAKSAANDINRAAQETAARAAAEALRIAIKAQAHDLGKPARSIDVLRKAAADIPGDHTVLGIDDANHDGLDDDGKLEVKVGDQYACVTVPAQGDNVDVSGGRC